MKKNLIISMFLTAALLAGCAQNTAQTSAAAETTAAAAAETTAAETASEAAAQTEGIAEAGEPAEEAENSGSLIIAEQGMFSAGGTVTDPVEGEYDPTTNWLDATRAGTTAHVDHANVFYQIPAGENSSPIVYLHGYGQSRMGWMTTPDGREGWSDLFLKKGHAAFLVDQPRRGEAGSTAQMTMDGFLDAWAEDSKEYKPGDQAWYTHFRIGRVAPERYEGSQFPAGDAAQDQFFRQMTPNTGSYDQAINVAALSEVMKEVKERTGQKAVYITHSQGGGVGWDTDMENVAAIVTIEPGGTPQPGSEQYQKLLDNHIPIVIYYGDYIDNGPEDIMSTGFWQGGRDGALAFAESFNADGGDATVVDLPKEGITGNSHFMFQELNNDVIADHIEAWLAERGLAEPVEEAAEDERILSSTEFDFPLGMQVNSEAFTGTVYLNPIVRQDNPDGLTATNRVTFAPGVHNSGWHTHGAMTVIGTGGIGYYQEEGQPAQIIRPGDVVEIPEGVKHWHGAAPDSWFSQIVIWDAAYEVPEGTEEPPVTEEQYQAAVSEAKAEEEDLQSHAVSEAQTETNTISENTIVMTAGGQIAGSDEDGIYQYLGVPYAKAEELFVPAEPVEPWEGVYEAVSYGNISYQSGMFGQAVSEASPNESNNAQNLNIWTPGTDDNKRPVMVWLHGGGFSAGSANEAGVDGENLARSEDVVVVGINHRLGVYGHLDLSAYGDKYRYSANVGLMDIIDALKWIHENIAAFGGDPDNVTLFGESGGGAKVLALMSSPYAEGLFQRGIMESGATEGMGVSFAEKEVSADLGAAIIEKLRIEPSDIEKIQEISYGELQAAAAEAQKEIAEKYQIPVSIGTGYAFEWEPVVEGDFLLEHPVQEEGFADAAKDYPLLIGSNLNEWNNFMADQLRHSDMSEEAKEAFIKAYPNEDPEDAENVDMLLRLPILKITAHKADQEGADVYSYLFTRQAGDFGSYHGAEIPYVFNNATDDAELAATISGLWASFARDGVPSLEGIEKWEPYTRESGAVMILDDESYLAHHHDEELIRLLAPDYEW